MTSTVEDEYALSSGLPLDGAEVEITAFEYGFNANIGAGILCANIAFTKAEDGDVVEQSFSVGDGWEARDKGASIATGDGKPRKLSSRSNWGRFVEHALKVAGRENMPPTPKSSDGWVGTKWTLGTTPVDSTNPTTGVKKTKDAVVPVAFLGKATAGTKASGSKSTAAKGKVTLETADPELWASLVELAGEHDSHTDFMAAALERDDVDGNPLATNAVVSTKPGGIWAAKS